MAGLTPATLERKTEECATGVLLLRMRDMIDDFEDHARPDAACCARQQLRQEAEDKRTEMTRMRRLDEQQQRDAENARQNKDAEQWHAFARTSREREEMLAGDPATPLPPAPAGSERLSNDTLYRLRVHIQAIANYMVDAENALVYKDRAARLEYA